ncbi:MAG: N-acetyltransferase [Promethearchaeota archaeon]|nr:MAG: N-acetyltransferase [Candidatus Lokiarchaeota archaeon]
MTEDKEKEKPEKPFTFIKGESILLTPLKKDHARLYAKWRNNPKVRIYGRGTIPATEEQIKKQLEPPSDWGMPTSYDFEIWHKQDNKPIGDTGLFSVDWYNRKAYIGMMIGEPDYWNQNLGTECTRLMLDYAFGELNLTKIYANIFSPNIGSIKCAEKNGLKLEATLKDDIFIDGEYKDTFIYTINQDQWKNNKDK